VAERALHLISNIPEILRESFRLDSEAVADGMSSAANVGLELIQLWGDTNALRNVAPEAALSYAGKVLSEHRALLHVSPKWRVRSFFPGKVVFLLDDSTVSRFAVFYERQTGHFEALGFELGGWKIADAGVRRLTTAFLHAAQLLEKMRVTHLCPITEFALP